MGVPTSPVDIANIAIDLIGDRYITSIDQPETATAEIMARNYDQIRQATLREFIWPFAKNTQVLAQTGDGNITFHQTFLMPEDCLRLLEVFRGPHTHSRIKYEIQGRDINCNSPDIGITIKYIRDETNVPVFDSCFVQIVAIRLAMRCAQRFTLKPSVTKMLQEELKLELIRAISIAGQESVPQKLEYSNALAARMGWTAYPTSRNKYINTQWGW
jgi:hypothetical protein